MTHLSVNLNKIALLRNQRDVGYPSPVEMARVVINAGAHGVTVHPRPDRRHVRPDDVRDIDLLLAEHYGGRIELNVEGNPEGFWMDLVCEVAPTQATLVPDMPDARTSDAGWDVAANRGFLTDVIGELHAVGSRVSLFVEADPAVMAPAAEVGADRVELYTGPYAHEFTHGDAEAALTRYAEAAEAARAAGLEVNAGHDLSLENLAALRQAIPHLAEVSIGHAITADALVMGFQAAVHAYLAALAMPVARRTAAI
jgi:pyridoxine 5-phosphate synthase